MERPFHAPGRIEHGAYLSPNRLRAAFLASASGRSHRETCSGYIVSLATPARSSPRASRSVAPRNRAPKASKVFAASYLRR